MSERGKIQRHKLETVRLADIEIDPLNPNRMSPQQEFGLEQSLLDFGDVQPIVLSEKDPKTGKHKIADGEHRIQKMVELGETETEAYILPQLNNDRKRRMMRQIMNKLHGQHDLQLDINELSYLLERNSEDLRKYLNIDSAHVGELQRLLEARSAANIAGSESSGPLDEDGEALKKEFDDTLPTKTTCPSCGYAW